MSVEPVIIVQGGAGVFCTIAYNLYTVKTIEDAILEAARRGYQRLIDGDTAVDAVEAAVMYQEEHPTFNTGRGSCLTSEGRVEMDASIMDGKTLATGAVAGVSNVHHPVQLARLVMEKTEHVLLAGEGADKFAREQGVRLATQDELITDRARQRLKILDTFAPMTEDYVKAVPGIEGEKDDTHDTAGAVAIDYHGNLASATSSGGRNAQMPGRVGGGPIIEKCKPDQMGDDTHDTVGAVAMDCQGNVAFATSSGGRNAQMPGRVGDSPIIGSGGYADNQCGAVSTTGDGEAFIKKCAAKEIALLMKQGMSPEDAINACLGEMKERLGGLGGMIAINSSGQIGVKYNTPGMSWVVIKGGKITYGIFQGEVKEANFDTLVQTE